MSDHPIADGMTKQMTMALARVPAGKRAALLIVADDDGTRAQLAARVGKGWTLAVEGSFDWHEAKPSGYVAVEWVG